jgi:Protein of unknown function (DUF1073)
MTDSQWQDQKKSLSGLGKRSIFKKASTPSPYDVLAAVGKPERLEQASSVQNQLSLTLWHVVRDLLAPIRIVAPVGASLAVQDLHKLLAGKSVHLYAMREVQALSVSLHEVVMHYFLHERADYARVQVDALELILPITASCLLNDGEHLRYKLQLSDGSTKICNVLCAAQVKGMGSTALQAELEALFALRAQLFRGIKHATSYSHKVVVQVPGLTALMAEAASDPRLQEGIRSDLNAQVTSLFTSANDLALVDSQTKISSFHLEVGQLEEINNYIYSELARILQVPKTKLLGQAASGLGDTGAYDYQHYQDYLDSLREHLLYPLLDALQIHYQLHRPKDLQTMQQALQLLQSTADLTCLSPQQRSQIQKSIWMELDL